MRAFGSVWVPHLQVPKPVTADRGLRKAFLLGTSFAETSAQLTHHISWISVFDKASGGQGPSTAYENISWQQPTFLCDHHRLMTWVFAHWEMMICLPWRQDLVTFHLLLSDRMPAEAIPTSSKTKHVYFWKMRMRFKPGRKSTRVVILWSSPSSRKRYG